MRVGGIPINKPILLAGEFWKPMFYPYATGVGFYTILIENYYGNFRVSLSDAIKGKVYRETAEWLKSQSV